MLSEKQLEFLENISKIPTDSLERQINNCKLMLRVYNVSLKELELFKKDPKMLDIKIEFWKKSISKVQAEINIRERILDDRYRN